MPWGEAMVNICPSKDCTGCGLCTAVCPVHCISMQPGQLGHLYPHIDSAACIDCGACSRSCPSNASGAEMGFVRPDDAYAAWANDSSEYLTSASGGAASVLARYYLSSGGIVYGCSVCPGKDGQSFDVQHIRVGKKEDPSGLKGSKYVQSSIRDILPSLKNDVRAGQQVLFIGTPCQAAAVRSLFSKEQDNLLVVDLVCHGVPSLAMLRNHVSRRLHMSPAEVENITFRDASGFRMVISGRDGRPLYVCRPLTGLRTEDLYYCLFMDGFTYRESCYRCRYACVERVSDMTLGDFWGLDRSVKTPSSGVSLVLPVTEKGKAALDILRKGMTLVQRPVQEAVRGNEQLRCPKHKSIRIKIFRIFEKTFGQRLYYLLVVDRIILKRIRKILWAK